jgi:hypothetical protein
MGWGLDYGNKIRLKNSPEKHGNFHDVLHCQAGLFIFFSGKLVFILYNDKIMNLKIVCNKCYLLSNNAMIFFKFLIY